jgi:hypothetical protein
VILSSGHLKMGRIDCIDRGVSDPERQELVGFVWHDFWIANVGFTLVSEVALSK